MNEKSDKQMVENLYEGAINNINKHSITNAIYQLSQALQLDCDNIDILNMLADCYYLLGEYEKSIELWEEVLRINADEMNAHDKIEKFNSQAFQFWLKRYNNAIFEMEKKNYLAASELFHALLKEYDGNVSVYKFLGLSYFVLGNTREAKKIWKKGLQIDKLNPDLLSYIARPTDEKQAKDNIINEARNIKRQSVPAFRQNRFVWVAAGTLFLALLVQTGFYINNKHINNSLVNKMQKEMTVMKKQLGKEHTPELFSSISCNKEKNNYETNEVLTNEFKNAGGAEYDISREKDYYYKGYQAYLQGDRKTAISNLSMVVDMNSMDYLNREALYYLARTYYLNQNWQEASKYYETYLQQFPETNYHDDSLYYLGCVCYEMNDYEKAKNAFNLLKEYAPESTYIGTEIFKKVIQG